MELRSFESIMAALAAQDVRFLVVGGMAVVAHGHGRLTHDLDLVIDLERDNILRTFAALASLGYQPRVPVTAENFADPAQRRFWIDEKNMTVLNLYSDQLRATPVDLFVTEPFDFATAYERAHLTEIDGVPFRFVDLATLIAMKEAAGRAVDLDDVRHLRLLLDEEGPR
jgi:predicted nucleotidyltransferase